MNVLLPAARFGGYMQGNLEPGTRSQITVPSVREMSSTTYSGGNCAHVRQEACPLNVLIERIPPPQNIHTHDTALAA